jgi:AMP phosphorylase
MRLTVKDMDIATGDVLVAIINEKDALKMDIHALDRIKIQKGNRIETVIVNIAESEKAVPEGHIGVFQEVTKSMGLRGGDTVSITLARKPWSLKYIKKKLDGGVLNKNEIYQIVWDIVHNKLDHTELTYFVAACYTHTMSLKETMYLTKAMAYEGDILNIRGYPIMDKHCVGGVPGNRTTIVIVPLCAAAGLIIPKTSSRSITSPAGTADTVEVLTNVSFSIKDMKRIVEKTNACMVWGGALNLAPADDYIIKVERPLSIDAKSQLLASVMAKKASVSATHVLIDIPYGKGAKIETREQALKLKRNFLRLGDELGMILKVILTDGSQPVGNGIGPALEARDVLWLLRNDSRAPSDLRKKSLRMAGYMLEMAGKAEKGKGFKLALKILKKGMAYAKMVEIIKAQKGKEVNPEDIPLGKFCYDVTAKKTGRIAIIDNNAVSRIARVAGAPADKGAGIYLYRHVNDKVRRGEKLFTIYANNKGKLDYAKEVYKDIGGVTIK